MEELIVTIRKAGQLFGLSSYDVDQNIIAIRQIDAKSMVYYEDLIQLYERLPGTRRLMGELFKIDPKHVREHINANGMVSNHFFVHFNEAYTKAFPELNRIVLHPTESEWAAAEGLFGPMMDWCKQALASLKQQR